MESQPGARVMGQPKAGASFTCKDLSIVGLAFDGAQLHQAKKLKAGGWRQTCFSSVCLSGQREQG